MYISADQSARDISLHHFLSCNNNDNKTTNNKMAANIKNSKITAESDFEDLDEVLAQATQQVEENDAQLTESTLASVNGIGMLEQKPVLKLADLELQHPYPYQEVRLVKTQFQERAVVVEFEDSIVYLPRRFAGLKEHQINLLNQLSHQLYFICEGQKDVKSGNPTSLVQFVQRTKI